MKIKRQAKIMEIISAMDIETQEQLLDELQKSGFNSTQATISRDIKELRIVKELTSMGTLSLCDCRTRRCGGTFSARLNTIFRECVTSIDYAQNMVVIKTHAGPGLRGVLGHRRDEYVRTCVGSLAGDDTAFLVMRDTEPRRRPSARRSRSCYRTGSGQGGVRCFALLHIENIAVIEAGGYRRLSRGFNVLTGETGAGKSIVIDAISAILGERDLPGCDPHRRKQARQSARSLPRCRSLRGLPRSRCPTTTELLVQRQIYPGREECLPRQRPAGHGGDAARSWGCS